MACFDIEIIRDKIQAKQVEPLDLVAALGNFYAGHDHFALTDVENIQIKSPDGTLNRLKDFVKLTVNFQAQTSKQNQSR